ncbi:DUF934 domain-containing protein [Parendozoicomonas haliclonae]|uniref:DUF934 domain-containing protein n=1 Tax=Parendozoicomonas haliclonae TaxID=1960125 RepID=A0A1X7AMD7_9GAMM|nr:DUF934 domain-containing protein [Parendozoicomonas haliclonae]SMA49123.1 hypothetical protein EHSB41UT_03067 [Parendozoicomonas haliclonae]
MPLKQPELLASDDAAINNSQILVLETDTELEAITATDSVDVIAIRFEAFTDGRGFSLARMLREQRNFQGTLRAMGDFLPDQMHYLARCGFDSFVLPEGTHPETATACLNAFTEAYQTSVERPEPLFRRQ